MTRYLNIPIYKVNVLIVFGEPKMLYDALSNRYNKDKTNQLWNELNGFDILEDGKAGNFSNGLCFLWMSKTPETRYDYSVLSHEIFHLTISVMKLRDIPFIDETEEAYAYLIEHLTSDIHKLINE